MKVPAPLASLALLTLFTIQAVSFMDFPMATEVAPVSSIQVDMDAVHRLAADATAKDEMKKSDELHAMAKANLAKVHAISIKTSQTMADTVVKRDRVQWVMKNPEAAEAGYLEERKRLDDDARRERENTESANRIKIQADRHAAQDYAMTHHARMESRNQMIRTLAFAMIGYGAGLLTMPWENINLWLNQDLKKINT